MSQRNKRKQRRRVFHREGGLCFYCDEPVSLNVRNVPGSPFPPYMATLDHIIPKCEGGERNEENSVCACWRCNNKRGTMPADQFLTMMYEGR